MAFGVVFGLMFLGCWSALARSSMRDFSYRRLEEIAAARGKPGRFSEVLKRQDSVILALELLLTASTMGFSVAVCLWLGGIPDSPLVESRGEWASFVLRYILVAGAVILAVDACPWLIARVAGEQFIYLFWPTIRVVELLLTPFLAIIKAIDRLLHHATGMGDPDQVEATDIGDEIRTVVDEGQREGVIESGAGNIIQRVMELQGQDVGAIMVPRTEMFCLQIEATLEEARQKLIDSGHSRAPVIGESTDDIIGILYAKELLKALDPVRASGPLTILRDIVRDPYFIPETTGIQELLELMKRQRVQIAIVLDEYGGVAGLVTMEDILEEIVGEIHDEYDDDVPAEQFREIEPNAYDVDARLRIEEFNDRLSAVLPADQDYDTVGGFVFSEMGRIPEVGDSVIWNQLKFTVTQMDQRRLARLRIDLQVPTAADGTELT